VKQVVVVNEALRLPRGKLAAQVAHASVAALLRAGPEALRRWLAEGMPKVVLHGESEADLRRLHALAVDAALPAELIEDAGRTIVPAGTLTCLGLGPADDAAINALTGSLRLVR
jgi:peptidyl-tRNA hydrolase, PTH2 family